MLLTTQGGLVVQDHHILYLALRREEFSPSAPQSMPPTFRVLLMLPGGEAVVAARGLSESTARFIREDIAHHWEIGKPRWKATDALKRIAEGAYFAADGESVNGVGNDIADGVTLSAESEVTNGEFLPPLHDL